MSTQYNNLAGNNGRQSKRRKNYRNCEKSVNFYNPQSQQSIQTLEVVKYISAVIMGEKGNIELKMKARFTNSLKQFENKRFLIQ